MPCQLSASAASSARPTRKSTKKPPPERRAPAAGGRLRKPSAREAAAIKSKRERLGVMQNLSSLRATASAPATHTQPTAGNSACPARGAVARRGAGQHLEGDFAPAPG